MGWWSATIMGGDAPLDYQGLLAYDITGIGVDRFYDLRDNNLPELAQIFELNLDKMIEAVEKDSFNDGIAKQVLGVLIIETGVKKDALCQKALDLAIEGAEQELNDKERLSTWCDPEERKFHLENFIEACKNYEGKPIELPHEGLFEKMMNLFETSKES